MTKFEQLLEAIGELPLDVMADLETGSHYGNNQAAARFHKQHPALSTRIRNLIELANHLEDEKTPEGAAPELLTACQSMLKTCGGAEHWQGETRKSLLLMEEAVAKAGFPHVSCEVAL